MMYYKSIVVLNQTFAAISLYSTNKVFDYEQ